MDGNLRKEIYSKVDPFRANCKRIHDDKNSVGMSFDTALMLLKEKGYSMKRQKWEDKVHVCMRLDLLCKKED